MFIKKFFISVFICFSGFSFAGDSDVEQLLSELQLKDKVSYKYIYDFRIKYNELCGKDINRDVVFYLYDNPELDVKNALSKALNSRDPDHYREYYNKINKSVVRFKCLSDWL